MNLIINDKSLDPRIVDAVRDRVKQNATVKGTSIKDEINAIDVGLVPNFSYPVKAAQWNDKWTADGGLRGGAETSSNSSQTVSENVTQGLNMEKEEMFNGNFSRCFSPSPSIMELDLRSGQPSRDADRNYSRTITPRVNPSAYLSETSHNNLRTLPYTHKSVDINQKEELESLKSLNYEIGRLTDKLSRYKSRRGHHFHDVDAHEEQLRQLEFSNELLIRENESLACRIAVYEQENNMTRQENSALWDALIFGKGRLKGTFEREDAVLEMIWDFKQRQLKKQKISARELLPGNVVDSRPSEENITLENQTSKPKMETKVVGKFPKSKEIAHNTSLASIRSYLTRRSSFARICSYLTFSTPSKRNTTGIYHDSERAGTHDSRSLSSPHSYVTSSFSSSPASTLTDVLTSASATTVFIATTRSDSDATPNACDRKIKIKAPCDKFPTVEEEVDALLDFADLHIRTLIEDYGDLVQRVNECLILQKERKTWGEELAGAIGNRDAGMNGANTSEE